MCMFINKEVKARKPNKDGYCLGWKLISPDDTPIFMYTFDYFADKYIC